jgi:glycosyltransferase involved in cell wall biosynthesis
MKITFIYAYDGEPWSTPIALLNEFKKLNWETEIISIGSNKNSYYHDINLKKWIESKPKTDIVLFMDWGRFDSPYLNKNLVPAFWIQESGDDPQNFERNYPKSNRFHLTITPDHDSYLEYKNRGTNVEWVNHFADTNVQYPMEIDPEYIAVTTRGKGGSQFLDQITDWSEGSIGNQNNLEGEKHTEFLNKGLMVIQNSRWGEITRRIFEGMACGKLIITDRLTDSKKLHELFIEGQDIIYYDGIIDCINKINYYAEHADERETIAQSGMKKLLENYTQTQVVNKLIKQWENYQSQ